MPIHVAITRRVRAGREAEFQEALREFFRASFARGGVLGATLLVPPPGSDSREFGILRTFADERDRDAIYASAIFKAWEARCQPLTEPDSWTHRPLHGLEAWFRSPHHAPPPRWKMAIATFLGVFSSVVMVRRSTCGNPRGRACPWPRVTSMAPNATRTAAPRPRINSWRVSRPPARERPAFSDWAATALRSERDGQSGPKQPLRFDSAA